MNRWNHMWMSIKLLTPWQTEPFVHCGRDFPPHGTSLCRIIVQRILDIVQHSVRLHQIDQSQVDILAIVKRDRQRIHRYLDFVELWFNDLVTSIHLAAVWFRFQCLLSIRIKCRSDVETAGNYLLLFLVFLWCKIENALRKGKKHPIRWTLPKALWQQTE